MEEKGIDYGNSSRDTFKVALVGGFGNFYLVKKQVMDLFRFVPGDRRQSDIIRNKSDCEKAISLGRCAGITRSAIKRTSSLTGPIFRSVLRTDAGSSPSSPPILSPGS